MKYIVILILSTILLFSSPTYTYGRADPVDIILVNNIDIDGKSIKGWIRIFNSMEKCRDYGFNINEADRLSMLQYMKNMQYSKTKRYNRSIK